MPIATFNASSSVEGAAMVSFISFNWNTNTYPSSILSVFLSALSFSSFSSLQRFKYFSVPSLSNSVNIVCVLSSSVPVVEIGLSSAITHLHYRIQLHYYTITQHIMTTMTTDENSAIIVDKMKTMTKVGCSD